LCISWTNKRFDNINIHGGTVKIKVMFSKGAASNFGFSAKTLLIDR